MKQKQKRDNNNDKKNNKKHAPFPSSSLRVFFLYDFSTNPPTPPSSLPFLPSRNFFLTEREELRDSHFSLFGFLVCCCLALLFLKLLSELPREVVVCLVVVPIILCVSESRGGEGKEGEKEEEHA